ncbi:uncharacterized protein DUF4249 [Mucilaginibacter gracilis]|uniref:Uncharacterized protein DUF4249 n=1 Tax=Mucilaginibacter gracilis TaxID=423350 RepID=A0A495J9N9_9SPHI|nr:DUF4249 family protein [Mucilaginibacter gracilis]RKR85740.1 uncharacterized protein DUF4249 [Mucilaginibacter gracilis]
MEIKYKQYLLLIIAISAFAFSSCKKTETSNVAAEPVVIGYLIPGQPISIKVYQQKDISDTANYGPAITGLKLTLSNGTSTVSLTESAAGTYTYSNQSFLAAGKTYTLQFTYNGLLISASSVMPAKPLNYTATRTLINLPLSSLSGPGATDAVAITFKWDNPDSLYHVLVFKNDDANAFNIHPDRNSALNFTLNAKQAAGYDVYYRTFNYIGVYRAILFRVNKEYLDILNSNASSTSQNLTNPPTNITNGFGIFSAMQADTIKLTLTQY